MRRFIGLTALFVCVALIACSGEKEAAQPLPEKEILIELFVDLHLAEMPLNRVPYEMRDSVGAIIRGKVAAEYDMDPDELSEIVERMQLDMVYSVEINDSVLVRLERMYRHGEEKE